ncbi:MAG: leucine-rich repeat protein [Clostridiales bacterium]|nr:leucine-rich repeat protein [Clostridiales bacterium]
MRKWKITRILFFLLFFLLVVSLVACSNKTNDFEKSTSALSFKTLQVDGNDNVYGKVSNATETFSFLKEITVSDGVDYTVCTDLECTQEVPSKTVSLQAGDNTFYILAVHSGDLTLYTVTIRRRPMYTVMYNTNGGSLIASRQVEEDDIVNEQIATKTGYTFIYWTVNNSPIQFPYTITKNTILNAEFKANEYTATLDVNGGDTLKQTEFPTTFDKQFTFVTPTRTGYTFLGWYDGDTKVGNAIWKYPEDKTFVAKWQVNAYLLYLEKNDAVAGTVTGAGSHNYGESVTITATTNDGYNFLGWYDDNDTLISANSAYTFTMGFSKTLYAKWDFYTVTTLTSSSSAGSVTTYNSEKISVGKPITITATETGNLGYTWSGWYTGDKLVSTALSYTFTMQKENIVLTATWNVWDGLEAFDFTSTPTTLIITGLKSTLTTIVIPEGVTSIAEDAFSGCSTLISIEIPSSVESIGRNAFYGCSNLTSIEVAVNNAIYSSQDGILYNKAKTDFIHVPLAIKSVTIPSSITNIGQRVFEGCSKLVSLEIPANVTSIGQSAFNGCSGLESLEIPFVGECVGKEGNTHFGYIFGAGSYSDNNNYVPVALKTVVVTGDTNIADYAFNDCSSIVSITISDTVTNIGTYVFYNCSSLESLTIPFVGANKEGTGKTNFGYIFGAYSYLFHDSRNFSYIPATLQTVVITGGASIDNNAFYECRTLNAIEMLTSVTSIGNDAFYKCSSLTSIIIPDSVKSIGSSAFYGCSSITKVNYIGDIAGWCKISFENSSSNPLYYVHNLYINSKLVTEIEIPKDVASVGGYTFYNCTSLESINIPSSVKSIGEWAFYGCSNLTSVEIPDSVTSIGGFAFSHCSTLTRIKLPRGMLIIEEQTFYDCIQLKEIEVPNSVLSIGRSAFGYCRSLESINIPNSVKSIGDRAFYGCSNLTSIKIPGSVVNIESYAFYECSRLTSIKLSNGITTIKERAFFYCSRLKEIEIPSSVSSIAGEAFGNCYGLTTIYYGGTKGMWNLIDINSGSDSLYNATIYYYSKTNPTEDGDYWHYDDDGITPVIWTK